MIKIRYYALGVLGLFVSTSVSAICTPDMDFIDNNFDGHNDYCVSVDAVISPSVGDISYAEIAAGAIIKRGAIIGATDIGEGTLIGREAEIGQGFVGQDTVIRRGVTTGSGLQIALM